MLLLNTTLYSVFKCNREMRIWLDITFCTLHICISFRLKYLITFQHDDGSFQWFSDNLAMSCRLVERYVPIFRPAACRQWTPLVWFQLDGSCPFLHLGDTICLILKNRLWPINLRLRSGLSCLACSLISCRNSHYAAMRRRVSIWIRTPTTLTSDTILKGERTYNSAGYFVSVDSSTDNLN